MKHIRTKPRKSSLKDFKITFKHNGTMSLAYQKGISAINARKLFLRRFSNSLNDIWGIEVKLLK
jgi:hypothetical protein